MSAIRLHAMALLAGLPLMISALPGCSETEAPATAEDPVSEAPALAVGTPISEVAAKPTTESVNLAADGIKEIDWDSLIPDDYHPEKILEKYDLDSLSDDDPRADELQKELKALWDEAPVREDLDGQQVKLPGFVVPVETDAEESTGFLLVPYYGACIHVPPPPANQTVYVVTEKGKGTRPKVFDVVWVSGDMSVKRIDNDVAEAGYTIYASSVEPYE